MLVHLDVFCAGFSCCCLGGGGGGTLATARVTRSFSCATFSIRTNLPDVAGTFGVSCFALFVDCDGERVRRRCGGEFECTPDAFDTDPDLDRDLDRDRDLDHGGGSGDRASSYSLDLTLQSKSAFNGNSEDSDAFPSCRGLLVLPSAL